ncbi:glutaminyl-peptide cyclotransferase [Glycomyces algeriensis]|uniref:glutaminyl-peptide cyclotransferase n=1 Tax=Glycomyces algeriensis TaxID=256037 RepID=UPI0022D5F107|nr:glutaminyl-peptide cyclotransferase [Glycomyces algeriensis]MDA1367990.1 glutaminyl-peptide cyclotransferase [Glycomyces algeriensis]MDR7349529.1 glutaminyl-peptide cyclotransferase [Glycomyces algeriensis]
MSRVFDDKRATRRALALGAAGLLALAGCGTDDAAAEEQITVPEDAGVEELQVEVLETFDHDATSFTQGLQLAEHPEHGTVLYESAGLYGESDVRITDPATGAVLASQDLPADQFAEGLTLTDDSIWQITWQEHVAHRRDPVTLDIVESVQYEGEGWGICFDGEQLVMSDGSSTLTFRDPVTFEETGTVEVALEGEPVFQINELECTGGQVWANLWQTDQIVRIDPATGEVGAVVDAAGLLPPEEAGGADVLNGIAAAEEEGTFYVTGKLWPKLYLVRFTPVR